MFVNIGNMPVAKSKVKNQKSKVTKPKAEKNEEGFSVSSLSATPLDQFNKYKKNKFVILAVIIILIVAFVSYKKSWFIAATVNGSPISNFAVLKEEDSQYRKQIIDQLTSEKIILDEAQKKGVKVSDSDIDAKIAEIEKQYGGAAGFDATLAQQGLTRSSVRGQIKLSLALEKLYGSEIAVTPDEVTKFIEQNKSQMQSTTSADLEKEANDIIKSQKQSQVFSQKFQDLKNAANIQIF